MLARSTHKTGRKRRHLPRFVRANWLKLMETLISENAFENAFEVLWRKGEAVLRTAVKNVDLFLMQTSQTCQIFSFRPAREPKGPRTFRYYRHHLNPHSSAQPGRFQALSRPDLPLFLPPAFPPLPSAPPASTAHARMFSLVSCVLKFSPLIARDCLPPAPSPPSCAIQLSSLPPAGVDRGAGLLRRSLLAYSMPDEGGQVYW